MTPGPAGVIRPGLRWAALLVAGLALPGCPREADDERGEPGAPPAVVDDDASRSDAGPPSRPDLPQAPPPLPPPAEIGDPAVPLARAPGPRFVEVQEVVGHPRGWVFYCSNVQGLNVLDARKPRRMRRVLQRKSGPGTRRPHCQHIAYNDTHVFISNRGDSIGKKPFVAAYRLKTWERAGYLSGGRELAFEGLATLGEDLVLAAMHQDGLAVLRHRGRRFEEIARLGGFENAREVAVFGEHACVTDGRGGLAVVELSEPAAPAVVGRVEVGGAALGVAFDPGTDVCWVSASGEGLVGVEVRDPASPKVVGRLDTPGSAVDVSVEEGVAWVADWTEALAVDVRQPARPILLAAERVKTDRAFPRVLGVGARGSVGFVGEWRGLWAYQLHRERGAPNIRPTPRRILFESAAPRDLDVISVTIHNDGRAPLHLGEVRSGSEALIVDRRPRTIAPGHTELLDVAFVPKTRGPQSTTLTLISDDPDEPTLVLPVRANLPGLGVGDEAPPVTIDILDGGRWRLRDAEGPVLLAYFATW